MGLNRDANVREREWTGECVETVYLEASWLCSIVLLACMCAWRVTAGPKLHKQ